MAKKKEILDDIVIDSIDNVKEEVEEVVIENVKIEEKEENVKIKLRKNHRCYYGDSWFDFEPEKVYIVPKGLKDKLMLNDMLLPL